MILPERERMTYPSLNSDNVSVIIGYEHSDDRIPLLIKCLKSLQDCAEVCIVETGLRQEIPLEELQKINSKMKVRYLKVYTTVPFNRAWAFNIGVRHLTTKDFLLLSDADLVFPANYLRDIEKLSYLKTSPAIGWQKLHYLDLLDTKKTLELPGYEVNYKSAIRSVNPSRLGAAGAVHFSSREIYNKVCGMDERFFGRAAEDNCHWIKLEALGYKIETIPSTLFHLFHKPYTLVTPLRSKVFDMLSWTKEEWEDTLNYSWGSLEGFKYEVII